MPLPTEASTVSPSGTTESNQQPFDVEKVRADFPILAQKIYDKPLVYLDNAATAQKPTQVIEAIDDYYRATNANIHRGVHALSQKGTQMYEAARQTLQQFVNASASREVVFVRGTTEGINLVAQSWGRSSLQAGDEIVISHLEHHSNIVPWQILCQQTGAVLKVVPIDDRGEMVFDAYRALLSTKTKLVSVAHISNALGTILPVKEIITLAHEAGALVHIDGAQAVPHCRVDVQDLGCDFYTFSGHKLYGPTGIGVLYGKESLLESMPPYQGGGDMIRSVSFEGTTYNELPHKFEAGTPHIVGPIGLAVAVDYVQSVGLDAIERYEHQLLDYATIALTTVEGVRLIGTAREKAAVLSFVVDGVHPHDVGTILDRGGVAVRTGHHCAQPVMEHFGVPATVRASLAFYNTREEIDILARGLQEVVKVFK